MEDKHTISLEKMIGMKHYPSDFKMTKTAQILFAYFISELILSGGNKWIINQRILAEKFSKHYNTIYHGLKNLQTRGLVQTSGKNKQTEISVQVNKIVLPSLLALLNNNFMRKMLENNSQKQIEEKKQEEQEKLKEKSNEMQKRARIILENSKYLANQLIRNILSAIINLQRTTYQEIDFEDYFITIVQIFQQIPEYLEEAAIPRSTFLKEQQIAITYKKRGRI